MGISKIRVCTSKRSSVFLTSTNSFIFSGIFFRRKPFKIINWNLILWKCLYHIFFYFVWFLYGLVLKCRQEFISCICYISFEVFFDLIAPLYGIPPPSLICVVAIPSQMKWSEKNNNNKVIKEKYRFKNNMITKICNEMQIYQICKVLDFQYTEAF